MRKGTAADALRDQELLAVRDELQAMAVAERTLNIYGGELYRLDEWLDGERLTDELLALYLSKLHVEGKAASTIGTVVAAAKFRAKNAGLACPVGVQAMKTASGIRRAAAAKGGAQQADAIGWEHAERMARMAERTGKTGGLRDAAMFAVGSDAMLRVSEVVALDVADLRFGGDGRSGAVVVVRRSKTDQEGVGSALYCGARLKRWLETAGIAQGALFRPVHENGVVQEGRLSARSLQDIVKRWASEAGAPGRITWHSLRIGSAQELMVRRASLVALQDAGRWQSPNMPARYVRGQLAAEGAMARLRYGQGEAQEGAEATAGRSGGAASKAPSRAGRKGEKKVKKTLAWPERRVLGFPSTRIDGTYLVRCSGSRVSNSPVVLSAARIVRRSALVRWLQRLN